MVARGALAFALAVGVASGTARSTNPPASHAPALVIGPTKGSSGGSPQHRPLSPDQLVPIDFQRADIHAVIAAISELTGINFLVDDSLKGTVTLLAPTPVRVSELYALLESILEVRGWSAVPSGPIVKIIPRSDAARRRLPTNFGSDPQTIAANDSIATQIFPLRVTTASSLSALVTPMVTEGAQIIVSEEANALIVTDISSNLRRIAELIQQLDGGENADELSIIPLQHASAKLLSEQLTELLSTGSSGGGGPRSSAAAQKTLSIGSPDAGHGRAKVLPDPRTNSLLVMAAPEIRKRLAVIVAQLDVERAISAGDIHVVYVHNANAQEVVDSLADLLQTRAIEGVRTEPARIAADNATNSIIINASQQEYLIFEQVIRKLDVVRRQVLVEVHILEASEEVLRELGIDWTSLNQALAFGTSGFGFTNFGIRDEAEAGALEGLGLGTFKQIDGETRIGAIMRALERNSGVNIVSTPHLLTSDNQEATIVVAENIPFLTQTRITETDPGSPTAIQSFDFKDVGITLKLTPHINQEGLVRLDIDSQFSKLIEGAAGTSVDTPTTAKRETRTVVWVKDRSTVVIGGLMRDDRTTIARKVPLLGDIPILGHLFSRSRDLVQKTNLLIFITPHIVTPESSIEDLTRRKHDEAFPDDWDHPRVPISPGASSHEDSSLRLMAPSPASEHTAPMADDPQTPVRNSTATDAVAPRAQQHSEATTHHPDHPQPTSADTQPTPIERAPQQQVFTEHAPSPETRTPDRPPVEMGSPHDLLRESESSATRAGNDPPNSAPMGRESSSPPEVTPTSRTALPRFDRHAPRALLRVAGTDFEVQPLPGSPPVDLEIVRISLVGAGLAADAYRRDKGALSIAVVPAMADRNQETIEIRRRASAAAAAGATALAIAQPGTSGLGWSYLASSAPHQAWHFPLPTLIVDARLLDHLAQMQATRGMVTGSDVVPLLESDGPHVLHAPGQQESSTAQVRMAP